MAKDSRPPREKVRLQKYLASCGVASRRAAEELIRNRRVSVNGKVITEMGFTVNASGADKITVDGRPIKPEELGILLLNKPKNMVSTLSDPEGRPTIGAYLTKKYNSYFPVGRLDWESEGLVILTNDGYLADILLHPRYQIPREYEIEVAGFVHDKALSRLKEGINLEDGIAKAIKVRVLKRNDDFSVLVIVVTEGRNRLVRRMMDKLGFPVKKLLRISHGPFRLGKIRSGQVQKLTEKEYLSLKSKVMNASDTEK